MSVPEDRDVRRLARELADTPGAVPVLVALLQRGSASNCETLSAAANRRCVDDAVRWLTAVNLVRRSAGSGTFDLEQSGTSYELTALGTSLTRSLTDLAQALREPAAAARKATVTED